MARRQAGVTLWRVQGESQSSVDLYWLPLGAGGHSVRVNGRIFEAVAARLDRREPRDLYHAGLEVRVPEARYVIEMTPIPDGAGATRGVVAEGPVGSRAAGRFRIFRYEVRRWRDGVIPDADEAVESPRRLTDDPGAARRVLDLVRLVPTLVWGRDELGAGEMWNSNSLIAWLLAGSGLDTESIRPPSGGSAPGWNAGLALAAGAADRLGEAEAVAAVDRRAAAAAVDARVLHREGAEELVDHGSKLTSTGPDARPAREGLHTFYGSRNSPRATVTAEPPTSTRSTASGEPSARA